ncbi:MAG TPA: 4Fe-4S dicluster domain-containing protein [Longimicrobiales bacterium]|nr:4Fe-4S dicluster domain-containing protein [Longimicrobiales bacterium]
MSASRRRFLKELGCITLGAGAGIPLLDPDLTPWAPYPQGEGADAAAGTRQWAMVVDTEKCLRPEVRAACVEACNREHNVPRIPDAEEEVHWIWSEPYEHVLPDQVHAHTAPELKDAPVLVLCNHCTEPACVKVCPTGATWKRESDGIVMMDMHRCIGCRYCMAACPYGSRSFNWRDPRPWVETEANGKPVSDYPTRTKGVVEKCTFCAERLRTGRPPACVEAANLVPGGEGALVFGDVSDPESEVSRVLREKNTVCRRVGLGTGPNVFYVVPTAVPTAAGEGRA